MPSLQKILVATDFSSCARAALDMAVEIATPRHATILLLHAYELPINALPDGTILNLDGLAVERIEAALDEQLQAERMRASESGVDVTAERVYGHAAEIIVRQATQLKADLIVMGTHGRSLLKRVLLGSVAEAVLRTAPCPVLVVRQHEER